MMMTFPIRYDFEHSNRNSNINLHMGKESISNGIKINLMDQILKL